ncbi:IS66 family transposase [Alkalicoccus luteus]|uniref:IS66 family transposase n=1 Tax=Alkalicoccus luteus TaxID=1237094 RepID=A0A969PU92_9BACI|nr:IS66 family transposase [Alkalicoccus luteus]NJP39403.1 IS66 family transposase [Alkalicoccus luteus]
MNPSRRTTSPFIPYTYPLLAAAKPFLKQLATQVENRRLKQEVTALRLEVALYKERLGLANQQRFGRSADDPSDEVQLSLFDEPEAIALEEAVELIIEGPASPTAKAKRKRVTEQPDWLSEAEPSRTVRSALPEAERTCPTCADGTLACFHVEVTKELLFIPARYEVVRREREVYECPACKRADRDNTIVRAPVPERPAGKAMATASVISHLIHDKYRMGVPLHRQEKALADQGIPISRQTMSNWILEATRRCLLPVVNALHRALMQEPVLHMDETSVQVLREPGRSPSSTSYMWVMASTKEATPMVVYAYRPSRGADVADALLDGFSGTLYCDGYRAYRRVAEDRERNGGPPILLAGCWAHLRRTFTDATKLAKGSPTSIAHQGVAHVNRLYHLAEAAWLAAPAKQEAAWIKVSEQTDTWFDWVRTQQHFILPKSILGKALQYAVNQEPFLRQALKPETQAIDNNLVERHIRPFVIGRNNWLFSTSPAGATASAAIYSLIETAKANGVNPEAYVTYLLETIPNLTPEETENLDDYLPWSPQLPEHVGSPGRRPVSP